MYHNQNVLKMKRIKFLAIAIFIATIGCNSNSNIGLCATECEYTIATGETAGTVPATLDGTYELTLQFASSNSPFPDGTMGSFTIENNMLTVEIVGEECITLKNPIETSPSEWTFKDTCRDNLIYSVSVTPSGELNEVNLGNLSFSFLGQFN